MYARPLRPDRLRTIEPPFGWIPFGILTSGLFERLSPAAKLLYFFLCLVADGRGISFYGDRRLRVLLGLSNGEIDHARAQLCRHDLLAFDGCVYQLLSLPGRAVETPAAQRIGGHTRVAERGTAPRKSRSSESLGEILRGLGLRGADRGEAAPTDGAVSSGVSGRRGNRKW